MTIERFNPDEKYECPLCGEYLKLKREGTMTNKKTNDFLYVYFCEECNQSFVIEDEKIKFIPYDADMKKIENKCKICGEIKNYNQDGLFLLNIDTAYYEFHCFNCATKILQNWADNNLKDKVELNKNNIHGVYEIYDLHKNNEMLKEMNEHPEKYKKTMDKLNESLNKLQPKEAGELE